MNSLAFSLVGQIGFSRRHFFVVNGLAFPRFYRERQSDLETPEMARSRSIWRFWPGLAFLTRAQPKREHRRTSIP